ncbi:MAG TPA: serpin family protein [Jatrophihabitans sp.]|jgi:serpin B|uniref:serpin family protein n=1 Tax=Jatrophihabitans sp. TaxID=1932789 RepID=UPI002E060F60|nr:serpin family protein [Jatrophihabitans sp.]
MRPRSRSTIAVLLCAGLVTACGSGGTRRSEGSTGPPDPVVHARLAGAVEYRSPGHHATPAARDADLLARSEQEFSLALLRRLTRGGAGNVSVSPASLGLTLAMLQNGAAGTTRAEIVAALRASGLTGDRLDAGWLALNRAWSAAARPGSLTLSSANALWLQRGFPLRKTFLAALSGYFDAGVWQTDFSKGSTAADAMNRWTSEQTHGRITRLFDRLDPSTVLVLADAIYFTAAWATAFDAGRTQAGPFTRADGSTVSARFLTDDQTTRPVAVTPDCSAVQLPYRGGSFAALAVMPTRQSLPAFVDGLTSARLDAIVTALRPTAVDLALPRFTTTSALDLEPVLQSLGMRRAFTDSADLSQLSAQPTRVDQVMQRVYLAVAEKGTEAAAATGISVVPTSVRPSGPTLRLDHPFLFLIRDTVTGAILFATQVNDPTAG